MTKGEASDLFGRERDNGLSAILGNLDQSVFGEPAYPSIEAKAAHLLYFVVKNHPFSDGNKRSGAFLFVDFLHRNGRLFDHNGYPVINDTGLAALTLLVAESDPKQKKRLLGLLCICLSKRKMINSDRSRYLFKKVRSFFYEFLVFSNNSATTFGTPSPAFFSLIAITCLRTNPVFGLGSIR